MATTFNIDLTKLSTTRIDEKRTITKPLISKKKDVIQLEDDLNQMTFELNQFSEHLFNQTEQEKKLEKNF